jgi:hypothetical protein
MICIGSVTAVGKNGSVAKVMGIFRSCAALSSDHATPIFRNRGNGLQSPPDESVRLAANPSKIKSPRAFEPAREEKFRFNQNAPSPAKIAAVQRHENAPRQARENRKVADSSDCAPDWF